MAELVPTIETRHNFPPGIVGEVARYIYEQAPRPVHEIALAGSLAIFAGIVGRQFNVSGTGLNNYVMLIAPTGTGKEAVNQGISKLALAVQSIAPRIRQHIGPGEIRSDAALLRLFGQSKCFVTIAGEIGLLIKRMSGPRANPIDLGIKRVWLDLWGKSGHGNTLNPMVYSDSAKSTEAVQSPAFSIFGESTPEQFFEALDETMVADGLLPRFITIEYLGDRPDLNENAPFVQPPEALTQSVAGVLARINMLETVNEVVNVGLDEAASNEFRSFNSYCDTNIRGSNEVHRQLWNRAHLKAMKLAALVAVGVDYEVPTITLDVARWATHFINADIVNLIGRFERGEVGELGGNELAQQDRVRTVMRECIERQFHEVQSSYGGTVEMHSVGLVTHQYLQRRLLNLPMFRNDPIKATPAIKRAIQSLSDNAEIEAMSGRKCRESFGHGFLSYRFAEYDANNMVEQAKSATFVKPDLSGLVRENMK